MEMEKKHSLMQSFLHFSLLRFACFIVWPLLCRLLSFVVVSSIYHIISSFLSLSIILSLTHSLFFSSYIFHASFFYTQQFAVFQFVIALVCDSPRRRIANCQEEEEEANFALELPTLFHTHSTDSTF